MDSMEDKLSWMHHADYVRGKHDTLNQPVFGETLERMWGFLMQCNDLALAWKCPTPLSGKRIGGDIGDCQCFDE